MNAARSTIAIALAILAGALATGVGYQLGSEQSSPPSLARSTSTAKAAGKTESSGCPEYNASSHPFCGSKPGKG